MRLHKPTRVALIAFWLPFCSATLVLVASCAQPRKEPIKQPSAASVARAFLAEASLADIDQELLAYDRDELTSEKRAVVRTDFGTVPQWTAADWAATRSNFLLSLEQVEETWSPRLVETLQNIVADSP